MVSLQTQTARGTGRPPRHHDPNIREHLVEVAVELFAGRGHSATSVREIVGGAGVSKPVLYYHFGSKEGLYLEILRRLERTLAETVAHRDAGGGSARERIRRLALDIYDAFSENSAAVRFLNAVFWGPPQGTPEFDFESLHRPITAAFSGLVEEGIARGEFRAAAGPELSFAALGALSFAMDFHLAHPDRAPGREGLAKVLDLVLSGAAAPRRGGSCR
jgi:AcrR family transcriptional regulator